MVCDRLECSFMFVVPICLPPEPRSKQLITSSAVATDCSVAPTITETKTLIEDMRSLKQLDIVVSFQFQFKKNNNFLLL